MSLKNKPHYTLPAAALADWIENRPDQWWSIDGDPHLMSVLDFPCPSDELAPAIRKIDKNVLIYDKTLNSAAHGELIGEDKLTALADRTNRKSKMAFLLSWGDSDEAWLLLEDEALVQTTK